MALSVYNTIKVCNVVAMKQDMGSQQTSMTWIIQNIEEW